ncbi:PREDICTED: 4-coumarate--CoA ligase 1-like [Priapulus caudatus]|uniref:4-coumarate--CoA ligase 1-like n=1 Tax=Priapulus caudatus TaxID=37621 RepID=A0ABM1E9M5_PRICU|nr:PREDICTED: 4-coumarate--CoA ligase 1-like [Priapulus caudatus]
MRKAVLDLMKRVCREMKDLDGLQIMKGYLNNPTTSAFTLDKERWIHTGDVGYVDEDECLYIVDSIKELIMYKAYQVAPAELAAKLLQHPSVADAAVIGVPDEEAGELPKAYVVRSDQCLLAEDLHSYLRVHVESMQKRVRGGIEFVSEIPMSASGKILRRQLRARNKKLSRL